MFNRNKPGDDGFSIPNLSDREEAPKPVEPPRSAPSMPSMASAPRSTNLSTLSAGVRYEGNISGGSDLQVDGTLKGDVRLSRVMIGESGAIEGAITADLIEVRGRVNGSITAKTVKLLATSRVEGDITQEQLAIEPGAWFQGRSIQAKRELPPAAQVVEPEKPERYQPEKPVAPAMPGAGSSAAKPDIKSTAKV